jgi:hypothetical protein
MASGEVNISGFLREAGFDTPAAALRARAALEAAGLTRAGKQAFVASKLSAAQKTLDGALVRVCGNACLALDREFTPRGAVAREAVTVTKQSCQICFGSNNARAGLDVALTLARKGVRRVVLVGGSPGVWDGLQRAFAGADIELRTVNGTRSHTEKQAEANKLWAQLIVIWGSTELRHAVSEHYKTDVPERVRVITVSRRGVEALCMAIVESYR